MNFAYLWLLLPVTWSVFFGLMALRFENSDRIASWIGARTWRRLLTLLFIPMWLFFAGTGPAPTSDRYLMPADSILGVATFAAAILLAQFTTVWFERKIFNRHWKPTALAQLSIWSTLSFAVPLFILVTGLDSLNDRRLVGLLAIACAGAISFVARIGIRVAEGFKPRQVKSGDLYKRSLIMAKKMGVRLNHVSVIPFGRGRLTNAYGGGSSIYVTDDFGHWLHGTQLDFVIGHELAHVKQRHARKELSAIMGTTVALAAVALAVGPLPIVLKMASRFAAIVVPLLTFYALSRRFEYDADRLAVEAMGQGDMAIQALTNLYRRTGFPPSCGLIDELFSTHPSLSRRIARIEEMAGADRKEEVGSSTC